MIGLRMKVSQKLFHVFILALFLLYSCSGKKVSPPVEVPIPAEQRPEAHVKPVKIPDDQLQRSQEAEVEKYFLSSIPQWANSSDEGQCKREKDLLYIDYNQVKASLGLTNKQLLNFQYFVNELWLNKRPAEYEGSIMESILLKDKKALFDQARDQVLGGVNAFDWPSSPNVLIIDWDKVTEDNRAEFFKKYLDSIYAMQGMTVLFSRCKTSIQMRNWFKDKDPELMALQTYILGVEVLSIFSPDELGTSSDLGPGANSINENPLQFFWKYVFDDPDSYPSFLWIYDEKSKIKQNQVYVK